MIGRQTTLLVWALWGALVVAGQMVAAVSAGRFPGLGTLVGRAAAGRIGQSLFVVAWMWWGWHSFAR
jgi:hypothetical protein